MQNRLLTVVEETSMKTAVPKFEIGDTVDVHVRILEGDKERIQVYNGVVIARSGSGTREMFVVRRIVQGEGVERKFPIHSPRIADVACSLSPRPPTRLHRRRARGALRERCRPPRRHRAASSRRALRRVYSGYRPSGISRLLENAA